jgi:predicted RNase H-like nuclease (RuvC/YqgF family)
MIDEILTQERVGQKPRFFLHDEVKGWLVDNLQTTVLTQIETTEWVQSMANMDQPYYNRYLESLQLPTRIKIITMTTCDEETVGCTKTSTFDLSEYAKIIKSSSKRIDELQQNITQLVDNQRVMQQELIELKTELDSLKQK